MPSIEIIILIISLALIVSVLLSKVSERFGVPALLLFLVLGMLAGSDGPGGIYFDNAWGAQVLGVVALAFILFAGGVETEIAFIKPVLKAGISLATLGVLVTALIVGSCMALILNLSWLEGFLIGSIVSSTDAAAVFAVLRSRNVGLKGRLRPLLELESGSNDPMAVFLTISLVEFLKASDRSLWTFVPMFFQQLVIGALMGTAMAEGFIRLINRIRLEYEGLYPVLSISWVLLTYGVTAWLGGSGFLAVYLLGLLIGKSNIIHKKSLIRFHDGLSWLMQISMFLVLGLLVFPKQLIPIAGQGFLAAAALIFVARPVSVFLSLATSRLSLREKYLVSWVGLRGAVPIVLATFPLLAGLDDSHFIFNLVFFIVITSVLVQGTTIPLVAGWLKVDAPLVLRRRFPLEFESMDDSNIQLVDLIIPYGSKVSGRPLFELGFPKESLVTLVIRGDKYIMPTGDTVLEEGDVVLTLASPDALEKIQTILRTEPLHKEGSPSS